MLYVKQPFPDNHTPPDRFLEGLRVSGRGRHSFSSLLVSSLSIVHQIAASLLFLLVFVLVRLNVLTLPRLCLLSHASIAISYFVWIQVGIRKHHTTSLFRLQAKQTAKSGIIFLLTLLLVSPVLKTLTEDVSSDTVWVMCLTCLAISLASFDYFSGYQLQSQNSSMDAFNDHRMECNCL